MRVDDVADNICQALTDGGLKTMLVLSGVTDEATLMSPENKVKPDFYTSKLGDLLAVKVAA